jgi:hypothetical protein
LRQIELLQALQQALLAAVMALLPHWLRVAHRGVHAAWQQHGGDPQRLILLLLLLWLRRAAGGS